MSLGSLNKTSNNPVSLKPYLVVRKWCTAVVWLLLTKFWSQHCVARDSGSCWPTSKWEGLTGSACHDWPFFWASRAGLAWTRRPGFCSAENGEEEAKPEENIFGAMLDQSTDYSSDVSSVLRYFAWLPNETVHKTDIWTDVAVLHQLTIFLVKLSSTSAIVCACNLVQMRDYCLGKKL